MIWLIFFIPFLVVSFFKPNLATYKTPRVIGEKVVMWNWRDGEGTGRMCEGNGKILEQGGWGQQIMSTLVQLYVIYNTAELLCIVYKPWIYIKETYIFYQIFFFTIWTIILPVMKQHTSKSDVVVAQLHYSIGTLSET